MKNVKFYILTPYGNTFAVSKEGLIAKNANEFTGKWLFQGLKNVKTHEFIPLAFITPETISSLQLHYKNGNPKYTVRDLDHGTKREWGNTKYHGVKNIIFPSPI